MRRLTKSHLFWPALALVALLALNAVMNPGFFHIVVKNGNLYGSLIDILSRSAPLLLTSLGMTLVIATGGVDLSVGAVAAVAASVTAWCLQSNFSLPVSLISALAAAMIIGLWNGFLVLKLGLQPIIATLIAMVAGRGIAQLLVDGQIIPLEQPGFAFIGGGSLFGVPFSVTLSILAFVLAALFCRKTAAGLFVEAVGSSRTASRLAGVPLGIVTLLVYVLSGLGAGVAGLVASSNIRAVDVNNLGLYLELDAILAVVIGGTKLTGGRFSLVGTVLGALIIQTVSTTINTQGVAVEIMLMVKAAIVIAICLFQSEDFRKKLPNFSSAQERSAA